MVLRLLLSSRHSSKGAGSTGARPDLDAEVEALALLGQQQGQARVLAGPAEQLDEVAPLRALAEGPEALALVVDEHEVVDHVAVVGRQAGPIHT